MTMSGVSKEEVNHFHEKLKQEAEAAGYHLNPDEAFTKELVESILINKNRYGYGACPCRLASGIKEEDLDLICPCDYRDPDLDEFGACYCGLYISGEVSRGEKELTSIPERRPGPEQRTKFDENSHKRTITDLPLPVWRCRVCGYLCAREDPPETCPICKVGKERFERFL
ncbi:ferredoxin-thioredoxin reductase catalytic domain-containing protein [Methanobacterium petrolearium]|uniref:ferredoxin-thioredoxin reductase catalytic domain-containing protein n=1 Tax=Methanobacterium petrolearium TaxID=710190 RepID=UPI001AE143B7|nr:ferredoxin-thioredoxin reductase catalytic domain-containing protein [Methanobacterium petrolearium]MBP1945011.1 ferredoxin-thioredoxin reductase catalytic subunit/rubredoxin [Methanobacterium petrolearium]BDZ70337.1 ferredoxin:glutaredoxin reductase [Methanobacterium petrolearium]